MQLNGKQKGKQIELLALALCDGFRTKSDFEELVIYELNDKLDNLTDSTNTLPHIARNLIEVLDADDKIEQLIEGALKRRSRNPKLKFAAAAILHGQFIISLHKYYCQEIIKYYRTCDKSIQAESCSNDSDTDNITELFCDFEKLVDIVKKQQYLIDNKYDEIISFAAIFIYKLKNKTGIIESEKSRIDELDKLHKRIDENYLTKSRDYCLSTHYEALLRLNFSTQVELFGKLKAGETNVGACIIHGKKDSGQDWLLHKLLNELRKTEKIHVNTEKINEYKIKIDLRNTRYPSKNYNYFLKELSKKFSRDDQLNEDQIIEKLFNVLERQPIIIILNVDTISEAIIQELMSKFWSNLLNKRSFPPYKNKSYEKLFMFLIDEDNCVQRWTFPQLRDSWNQDGELNFLVRLPLIENLSCQDLIDWINGCKNLLPENLSQLNESDIKKFFLNESESDSFMKALPKICDKCDCNLWEHIDNKCLKN